jgi:hypothetical protein
MRLMSHSRRFLIGVLSVIGLALWFAPSTTRKRNPT